VGKAFISHASADRETANSICSRLESEGVPCWIAPRDISHGAEWDGAIVEALATARLAVVLLSGAANESAHVVREVRIAAKRRVPLLALRVEAIEPPAPMEYYLAGLHWLDTFPPPVDDHLPTVVGAVKAVVATNPEPFADEETVLRGLAEEGDPVALTNMGFLFLERGDVAEAEAWLRRGAEAGDAMAAATLGVRLKPREPDAAEPLLRQGAEAGDAMAATALGLLLRERGDGGAAEPWLRQGAEVGDAMAATTLGFVLEARGDLAGAVDWFRRGAEAGDQLATEQLDRLEGGR
jgi:TIR domain